METLRVAISGQSIFDNEKKVKKKLKKVIKNLIKENKAETFLFGSGSIFDELSLTVVTELKKKYYPHIERVFVFTSAENTGETYRNYLSKRYDKIFYPQGAEGQEYIGRKQIIAEMCDILLTYYDKEFRVFFGQPNATHIAVEYAQKNNKRIINLYEQLK